MAGRNACDDYCELHAHSNVSYHDGASHPEDLAARAALLEMPALAITDHAGMYAAVRLWKATQQTATPAARDAGLVPVRPIIGVELAIPRDDRELRAARRGRKLNDPIRGAKASRGWPGELHAGPAPGDHLVLLARDPAGYTALSRLISRAHLAGEKQFPVFERGQVETALDEARGHLIGLSGCCPTRSPASSPVGSWRSPGRRSPPPAPAAPGQRGSHVQAPLAQNAGWRWTSSATGFRVSLSPRARRRSHISTSFRTGAYGA